MRRAREIGAAPYDGAVPPLPEQLSRLDWDAWMQIRFRPDRALLGASNGRFRLQLFHLGHLFTKPVTINTIRDGIPTPVPYTASLFDYGSVRFDKPLPVNMGFAGFRIHFPLNDPRGSDELLSFVGSSYFRWLGRNQKYGLSARGLALNTGLLDNKEEFPFFREFWIDTPPAGVDAITIYALLDSPSVSGAFKFVFHPGDESPVDVEATIFPRQPLPLLGMAPLTSMFFLGENDRHMNAPNKYDEFRPELHDSDGLLIQTEFERIRLAAAAQSAHPGSAQLPGQQHEGLRPHPARPQFRALSGHRTRLRAAPQLLGRAEGRLGRGPHRADRARHQGRDVRQHHRRVRSQQGDRAGQAVHLRLSHPRAHRRREPAQARSHDQHVHGAGLRAGLGRRAAQGHAAAS